ncbi:fluoride export protein 1-like isoform X2 [Cornus florida]|uniref:fluoride export protein 1-like isoform X2 n=1 Tax=Cornus florida TaxID=4283 RepID=UPI00289B6F9C|nr:fluoride export protein 1-like isoform X2 [Cornus florida]
MDRDTNDAVADPTQSESFGRTSRAGSLRRRSFGFSSVVQSQIDDDAESESVSEAGDTGDRAFHSNRNSGSGRHLFPVDNPLESGGVVPIPEDVLLQSYGFRSHDPTVSNTVSLVLPLPAEVISPLSTNAFIQSGDKTQETRKDLPWSFEYIICLVHLAVFGIFGVGSFLMGWFGVVFKRDIAEVSDFLAIGLTTGYLGSLTTFSGWNQKMLDLSVEGEWVFVFLGFLVGLILVAGSIVIGIDSAKGFRWLLKRLNTSPEHGISNSKSNWKVDNCKRHLAVMVVLVLMLGLLWGVSATLVKKAFDSGSGGAQLWLACMVGPLGVWIRWWLARLNGRGFGRAGLLKWIPFGTLIANVSAACVMAALAIVKKVVNTKTCDNVASGIQFGLLGCLSTVSTFISEYNAMREGKHPWRAYAYALITIVTSFTLGTLIYSAPFWIMGYN